MDARLRIASAIVIAFRLLVLVLPAVLLFALALAAAVFGDVSRRASVRPRAGQHRTAPGTSAAV